MDEFALNTDIEEVPPVGVHEIFTNPPGVSLSIRRSVDGCDIVLVFGDVPTVISDVLGIISSP